MEVMPNAIQLMAQATFDAGLTTENTVAAMLKLQQTGGVISSKVLPHFAKRMQEAAQANGGLESALNSNRVAMNRMTTSFQVAADEFFKSGFSEGLTETFQSIGKLMEENSHTWKALGKIFGSVFKGVAAIIDNVVNPIFSALGSILHMVTTFLGEFSGAIAVATTALGPFGRIIKRVWDTLSGGKGVFGALTKVVKGFLAPIYLALAALEELSEFLAPTGKKTLIGTNINEVLEKSGIMNTLDRLESFFGKISTNREGVQATPRNIGAGTYRTPNYMQPPTNTGGSVVLQGDIYLDGQSVGQQVLRSEAASSEIDTRISSYLTGNR